MKILNPGTPPKPKQKKHKPWWIGKTITCDVCHFRAVVEAGDETLPGMEILQGRRINGARAIYLPCPTCGGTARYYRGECE